LHGKKGRDAAHSQRNSNGDQIWFIFFQCHFSSPIGRICREGGNHVSVHFNFFWYFQGCFDFSERHYCPAGPFLFFCIGRFHGAVPALFLFLLLFHDFFF
ncbi:MAG: hypothetical protein II993_04160, partial [Anaerotignum sp.]|nr:hypothetical protein [Anaerotignum sp.]